MTTITKTSNNTQRLRPIDRSKPIVNIPPVCPKCGTIITINGSDTTSVICPNCGTLVVIDNKI